MKNALVARATTSQDGQQNDRKRGFHHLVPKLRVWERTFKVKLCFRGGAASLEAFRSRPRVRRAASIWITCPRVKRSGSKCALATTAAKARGAIRLASGCRKVSSHPAAQGNCPGTPKPSVWERGNRSDSLPTPHSIPRALAYRSGGGGRRGAGCRGRAGRRHWAREPAPRSDDSAYCG